MSRTVLVVLGLVVLAVGIALAVALHAGKAETSGSSTSSPTTRSGDTSGTPSTSGTGPAPSLSNAGGTPVAANDPNHPRDYVVGDIHVRDHRAGDKAPLDIPPNVHPAEGRALPSTITAEISNNVQNIVYACAKDLPADQRGEKPRVEGQVEISIKGGKTQINKSTMQVRNITEGPAADAMKSCVEQKSIGLQNNAPDQQDLDAYTINLTYALP